MLRTGRGPVPADVAGWLQCPPGDEAVIRERLQLLDGVPAVISASYYPLWLAAGTRLESPDALPEGPDNLIEALGHVFARGVELLAARMPSPEEVPAPGAGPRGAGGADAAHRLRPRRADAPGR